MTEPRRISAREVRDQIRAGSDLVLACAYESEEKFQKNQLEGAISLSQMEALLDRIPKDRQIVFYCDCPNDETAYRRAEEYHQMGYENVQVLSRGVEGWREAGYPITVTSSQRHPGTSWLPESE